LPAEGYAAALRLPAGERPEATFASNTVLLKDVLLALSDSGLEVPRQMAVVAFDDFDWAPLFSKPLTVIDQHIEPIGQTAGSKILALLSLIPADGEIQAVIAPTLKVRESCGAGLPPRERPGAGESLR